MGFTAGQKVAYQGMRDLGEIISGPHPAASGRIRYLVKKADGNVSLVYERLLSEPDGRRLVVAKALYRHVGGKWESLRAADRETYFLVADTVLAALDADDKKSRPLAAGDKIRILKDRLSDATVFAGDVLMVIHPDARGDGLTFTTDAPRAHSRDTWYFRHGGEGTGWERV